MASISMAAQSEGINHHDVINSINSSNLGHQSCATNVGNGISTEIPQETINSGGGSPKSSPNLSPRPSPKAHCRREYIRLNSDSSKESIRANKSDDQSQEAINKSSDSVDYSKSSTHEAKKESRNGDRNKKKSWYHVLYPTYKSRSEDFKRIFKDVPDDERLVVDYSCALQREILVHGRLYVSQNYVCFYANIFMWETLVSLRWKDVTSITKEKTALVIPNAILICTVSDKFFLTSFGARDKTYLMLFRVWQNALIGQPMSMAEMWQLVHTSYGDELGLTSDDEDYVPPLAATDEEKFSTRLSVESFSEAEGASMENSTSPIVEPINEIEEQIVSLPPPPPQPRTDPTLDPTDLSDTTESEAEKHTAKLSIRGGMKCTSPHEGRELYKTIFPIHIDQLFTLLFTNSKFFLDFHTARKTTDLVQSAWTQNDQTGQKMRTISMTVSLTQTIGPRSSQVMETQIMLPCSRPGHLYCIDVECTNAGIPYADSFSVLTHYCMNSVSDNETSLTIFSQIKYKKNVWSFVKSMIEKSCWAGLDDYFSSIIKALNLECEEGIGSAGLKRKTRRRRRATCAASALQNHSPDNMSPNHQSLPTDLPHIHNNNGASTRSDAGMIVSSMLLVAVLCLMIINGLLYYKLWGLEEAAAYTIMDLHVLKNTPKTEEDWINLLQQQESLHNVEVRKWQRVLHTAAQLLRQTEESLTELQMSIHPTATEKMFSVLKPTLKNMNTRTEQQSKSEL
ncbi:protein Aster-B-like isoform X2 [Vespa mandarinia]|uniref:protein Aster-B-like isoform X2 n=1 Tax=Vespa mandarinia TaxID=7446 RepID=UPI0016096450|nr:protein Aster-B-like isoform X2 [Vespa mandarinia]